MFRTVTDCVNSVTLKLKLMIVSYHIIIIDYSHPGGAKVTTRLFFELELFLFTRVT